MKILKNKTYDRLVKYTKVQKSIIGKYIKIEDGLKTQIGTLNTNLEDEQKEHHKSVVESKLDFSIRRFIIGKKGTGKTTFIKEEILPNVKHFFVIDTCNEYTHLDRKQKSCYDKNKSCSQNIEKFDKAIRRNADKLIILEDSSILKDNMEWFMDIVQSANINFIIVCQVKHLLEKHFDYVDFIYDFGTLDTIGTEIPRNKTMEIIIQPKPSKSPIVTYLANVYVDLIAQMLTSNNKKRKKLRFKYKNR